MGRCVGEKTVFPGHTGLELAKRSPVSIIHARMDKDQKEKLCVAAVCGHRHTKPLFSPSFLPLPGEE
jgi:hypothetical protein